MSTAVSHVPDLLRRSGEWLLKSGIQDESGGIARYYRIDLACNNAVSTEITGYGISALCYLHDLTGEEAYLAQAVRAGQFLTGRAFDARFGLFPFEWPNGADGSIPPAYFFDCGIVVRGLLKLWRATGDGGFLDVARACGQAMAMRFEHNGDLAPILHLPECRPLEYGGSWSNNPGCYQLKSALAWLELHEETGDAAFLGSFESALDRSLRNASDFLPGTPERLRVMDRLHAFCYFLEALLPVSDRPACAKALTGGIGKVSHLLRSIRGDFVRSDVYAQLLRLRLYADRAGVVPLNEAEAAEEAAAIRTFQYSNTDPRLRGGFSFGKRNGVDLPFANPVSTAFCLQAIALWSARQSGDFDETWRVLI